LQSEVLQGTTYAIAVDTAYTTHTYICVYAVSSLAMSSSPAALQFYDVDSPVRNLAFTDLDLDVGQLGGTISWVAPADTVEVTGYVVYRSTSAAAAGRDQIGTSAVGTLAQNVPENTALGTYAFYNVYSRSSLAVMTSPVSVSALDNVAKASAIVFQDLDLDTSELGGAVSWQAATVTTYVASYAMYFATTSAGGSRSSRIGAASLDLTRAIAAETAMGNYQFIVVYARSSLAEQTTPAFLALADVASTPTNLAFADQDGGTNNLGGVLTWSAATDVSQVVSYRAYLATNTIGGSKTQLGADVPVGSALSVPVAAGTAKGTNSHFVVYAVSSQGQQSTPAFLSIVDLLYTGSWTAGAWGACSKLCGEGTGTQSRNVACSSVDVEACDNSTQPEEARSCSSWCPWTLGAWAACSKACGGTGIQARSVTCSSLVVGPWAAPCGGMSTQPTTTRSCSSDCPWVTGYWGACDCFTGIRARTVTCSTSTVAECGSNMPASSQKCIPRPEETCGCHDNGDHDPMRPWGKVSNVHGTNEMSCTTQWWVIFCIIVFSILLFCCCLAVCAVLLLKKKKAPPAEVEKAPPVKAEAEVAVVAEVEKEVSPSIIEIRDEGLDLIDI